MSTDLEREADSSSRVPSRAALHGINQHVANRIRMRRIMSGHTQSDFATLIGVAYQQQYKYETGVNRVSAGMLFNMAKVLDVSVDFFFEGLEGELKPNGELASWARYFGELSRNFEGIKDPRLRKLAVETVRQLRKFEEEREHQQ